VSDRSGDPWSVRFRRERERTWRELDALVTRVEKGGFGALDAGRLARLPVLYRATLSSLGVARASILDRGLLGYLESLTARAYLVVYAPKRGVLEVVVPFLLRGFPAAVRAIRWHLLGSAAFLGLGAAIAWAMVAHDAESYYLFVDGAMAGGRDPTASTEALRATLFAGSEYGLLGFASFLFTHNSAVGILTYGLGFAFGLPVVLLLFQNGMLLGAMSALFHSRDLAVEWWSWILPHGVTELLAIALCGAAGLRIGQVLVFPGRHPRLHELALAGRAMGGVVAGCVAMLLLAGVVEGVFRQVVQDIGVRYLLAAVFASLWFGYFALAGRRGA
jgi:uncharacterized membrane protein SpoIIM required for sporulation